MPRHAEVRNTRAQLAADDPQVLRAYARMRQMQDEAVRVYGPRGDVWAFIRDLVWTRDEASASVRRYPDKAYAAHLVHRWNEVGPDGELVHPIMAVPKSRRMIVSWLFIAANVWLAICFPGSKIAFLARKEGKTEAEGSAELVARANFICDHIPPVLPRTLFVPGSQEHTHCYLRFPNGSEILGLGQGADQARQLTFTSVLCDEVVFWEEAYETWIGLKPTIQGGGRITLVSSAGLGFFFNLVHDQMDQAS
jgi:hypothetical protein